MRSRFRDYRCVRYPTGMVLAGFGIMAFICGGIGALCNVYSEDSAPWNEGVYPLWISAAIMGGVAFALVTLGRAHRKPKFSRREAILTVSMIWLSLGLAGAMPFFISGEMVIVDSIFESISGLTTTGSTVLSDIEAVSMPILIWRSLLQCLFCARDRSSAISSSTEFGAPTLRGSSRYSRWACRSQAQFSRKRVCSWRQRC